jgi:uroporphyrinogen decarboxylase
MAQAQKQVPATVAIQGNFNPALLSGADPAAVVREATKLLHQMRGRNGHVFNLGHGVPPDAKMENLEALVGTVQNFA